MNDLRERLLKAIESSPLLRERLSGKVRYGVFEHDPSVAARIDKDNNETFGRFHETTAEFIPFTPEEEADFKRRFAWHFTKIFDKNNVVPFRTRKPPST